MKRLLFLALILLVANQSLKAQLNCADLSPSQYEICEDFTDGDITANPSWSGDTDYWTVVDGILQSAANAEENFAQLTTPLSSADDLQWEFSLNMDFNPSSNNYTDVYLMASGADLKTGVNGYFVRVGDSPDEVSLYRKDGTEEVKVIDGVDDVVDKSTVNIKVVVSRSATGEWILQHDVGNTGVLVAEATATDNTYTTSSHFGILIKYSSTRVDKFIFDNFFVGKKIEDTEAPEAVSVLVASANSLIVQFSEAPTTASATNTSNYQLNGNTTPTSANIDADDPTRVILQFASNFAASNTIDISGVMDIAGNTMSTASFPFNFVTLNTGDVIINEIFPDPSPVQGLPEAEFVELHNRTNSQVTLSGWGFTKSYPDVDFEIPAVSIEANGYIILCKQETEADWQSFGAAIGVWTSGTYLSNGGASLSLVDNTGNLINSVTYSDGWYQDSDKKGGGWTLELINPDNSCGTASNWIASQDATGGTPGTVNSVLGLFPDNEAPQVSSVSITGSNVVTITFNEGIDQASAAELSNYSIDNGLNITAVTEEEQAISLFLDGDLQQGIIYTITINGLEDCEGNSTSNLTAVVAVPEPASQYDVLINEIYADLDPSAPNAALDLPDAKYVELFNNSDKTISLSAWTFSDATKDAELGDFLMSPQSYVVLCAESNVAAFSTRGIPVLGVASFPEPNTTGDELTIRDDNGILIHQVNYNRDWYQDDVKESGGWSLELVDPNNPCAESSNWRASVAEIGGTPGAVNSVLGENADTEAPKVIGLNLVGDNGVALVFSETLDEVSASEVANYSIDNGLSITDVSLNGKTVQLTFSGALQVQQIYTLTINGVSDCVGNTTDNLTVPIGLADLADVYDVVINEIYADTEPPEDFEVEGLDLPDARFIELYNRSTKTINLANWMLIDAKPDTAILGGFLLLPDSYVILCKDDDEQAFVDRNIPVLGVDGFPTLNTSAESVAIVNGQGDVIHTAVYNKSTYRNEVKQEGGWTLEMIDPNNPCEGFINWRASEAMIGGTPGGVNSVLADNPDTSMPDLLRAEVLAPNVIQLIFSESLGQDMVEDASLYSIDNGIGTPQSVTLQGPEYFTVVLVLDAANRLQENTVYTITVGSGITDCAGNALSSLNTAQAGITQAAEAGDIVINEVLFNPASGGIDFVELYNNSDKIIDLAQWYIASAILDENPDSLVRITPITARFSFFPNAHIVLANLGGEYSASGRLVGVGGNVIIDQYGSCGPVQNNAFIPVSIPSMSDGEGLVALTDLLQTTVMDKLQYDADWHHAIVDDVNGVSLERIDPDGVTQDRNNWHSASAAVCYATPGYLNSQNYDVTPAEKSVSVDPKALSPDSDGFNDFTNISYRFDEPGYTANITIYDDRGREIRHLVKNELMGSEGVYKWDGANEAGEKASLGIYVIYIEVFKLNGDVEKFKETCVVGGKL